MLHDEEHDDFEDDAEAWLDNRLKSVDDRSIFSIYFYSLLFVVVVNAFMTRERKTFWGFHQKGEKSLKTPQKRLFGNFLQKGRRERGEKYVRVSREST